jgi:hypothetical protein
LTALLTVCELETLHEFLRHSEMLDFLGIGAQKAGTTWLYTHLSQHEKIDFPAGKEVHFWDLRYNRGIEWYSSLFAENGDKKNGEITPAYGHIAVERIREIRELNPLLRIIYIIRNPMERAWSAALMALERAEMTYEEASDQWFIDHFRSVGSLSRGDYEACLRRWRSVFLDSQLLVQRYEYISRAPRSVLKRCAEHIGVDPSYYDEVEEDILRTPVFGGTREKIRPALFSTLWGIYQARIERLERYLGEDLTTWKLDTGLELAG